MRKKNRLGSLGCGYQGSGLVCCPQVSTSNTVNPYQHTDGHKCGISPVQGQDYDGIGAYPWIARIGFKSNVISQNQIKCKWSKYKIWFAGTQNGEIKYPCQGSILNNRVILTAAHCALAKADNFKL